MARASPKDAKCPRTSLLGQRAGCCLAVGSGPHCPHPHSETLDLLGPGVPPWLRECTVLRLEGFRPQRSPLHARVLVVSWQQALQDKGCKSKSQGTKEEKLPKRQAPAPRRDREAPEAGGAMNVEKTGKGGLPADPEHPGEASAGGTPVASEPSPDPVLPSQTLAARRGTGRPQPAALDLGAAMCI